MKYTKFVREIKKYAEVDKSWAANHHHEKINNHSIPVAVRELKPIYKPCELGCGQDVSNQHIEYRRTHHNTWLIKCMTCSLYQDPKTGLMVDHRCVNKFFPPRNTRLIEDEDK